jgi:methylenetetrahydrofolate dehydrogenase (NADP+)/methenyltetrahydrofolate cyclohydrolase
MIKVDCKKYADEILEQVSQIPNKGDLLIVTTGHDPASESYVKGKMKDAEKCGIKAVKVVVDNQRMLKDVVKFGNETYSVGGIIIQLPLPNGFDETECVNMVDIQKDVDGFKLWSPFLPCTPEGIMYILKKELGDLTGKTALVIGRGKLVGEPIAKLLLNANCTVTIAHSKTKNLDHMLRSYHYDIIVCAAGVPELVDLLDCNASIVIDAGISKKDGKLCGDCYNFTTNLANHMKVATIPNGIGLMTRAMLMAHVARVEV